MVATLCPVLDNFAHAFARAPSTSCLFAAGGGSLAPPAAAGRGAAGHAAVFSGGVDNNPLGLAYVLYAMQGRAGLDRLPVNRRPVVNAASGRRSPARRAAAGRRIDSGDCRPPRASCRRGAVRRPDFDEPRRRRGGRARGRPASPRGASNWGCGGGSSTRCAARRSSRRRPGNTGAASRGQSGKSSCCPRTPTASGRGAAAAEAKLVNRWAFVWRLDDVLRGGSTPSSTTAERPRARRWALLPWAAGLPDLGPGKAGPRTSPGCSSGPTPLDGFRPRLAGPGPDAGGALPRPSGHLGVVANPDENSPDGAARWLAFVADKRRALAAEVEDVRRAVADLEGQLVAGGGRP